MKMCTQGQTGSWQLENNKVAKASNQEKGSSTQL